MTKITLNLTRKPMPIFKALDRHLSSKLAQQMKRSSGPYSFSLVRRWISTGSSCAFIAISLLQARVGHLLTTINRSSFIVNFKPHGLKLQIKGAYPNLFKASIADPLDQAHIKRPNYYDGKRRQLLFRAVSA
jgi:hypothetical protein